MLAYDVNLSVGFLYARIPTYTVDRSVFVNVLCAIGQTKYKLYVGFLIVCTMLLLIENKPSAGNCKTPPNKVLRGKAWAESKRSITRRCLITRCRLTNSE
jgi:hypothetical protein